MDAMGALLTGPRARGAFLLRSRLSAPWALRIADEAPLTVVAMVAGDAWMLPDDTEHEQVHAGDVVVLRGPAPYTVADDPQTRPQAVIRPGQRCTTPAGAEIGLMRSLGVRAWGNDPHGTTDLLTGTYQLDGEVSRRLLRALPAMLVIRDDPHVRPLVDLLAGEVGRQEPGQEAVLDRLLDLVLIATLRAWFARPGGAAPAWYRAGSDPVVGPALGLMHHGPEQPWTVTSLAAAVGVSRAAFARRFQALVGEPPMSFLTEWRLALAADLLSEPDATVESVARQVGYSSPYALSTAFKRERGVSPREHRATLVRT